MRILTLLVLAWGAGAGHAAPAGEAARLWDREIQPLVDEHCVKCHGPIEQKSGLVVDTPEGVLKGGDEGPAVVPGKPEESRFLLWLAADSDPHMPPKKQLSDAQREAVRRWIVALAAPVDSSPAAAAAPGPSVVPEDPAAAIDHFVEAGWRAAGVTAAPRCDDRTFVRRVWLDLAGTVPSHEDMEALLLSADPDKRRRLVEERLAAPEFARTMRELWDVVLMGRAREGKLKQRREHGWHAYLERAFAANRPWFDVLREIVVARPETAEAQGAQWFLYERDTKHQEIAEAVAPVLYGTRMDCAQCHDHPLAREIRQGHYWGLVAAFNRSKRAPGGTPAVEESAVGGFMNFTNLKKESQPAVIAVLGGPAVEEPRPAEGAKEEDGPDKYLASGASPKVPRFSRRAALAEAVLADRTLPAKAFVNRTWAQFFGRGLVHPVDEINSRNKASHPELLEWLTSDFVRSGGDVKRLVRGIVLSEAWQRAAWNGVDAPPASEHFASFAERPLPAETLARSLRRVLGQPDGEGPLEEELRAKFPDVMPREHLATTQQAMFLTNSGELAGLLTAPQAPAAAVAAEADDGAAVRTAFLRVLGRLPAPDEAAQAAAFLAARRDRRQAGAAALVWALLCGPEFLTNH